MTMGHRKHLTPNAPIGLRARVITIALAAMLAGSVAQAEVDPVKSAAVVRAAEEIAAVVKDADRFGSVRGRSDPTISALLDIACDILWLRAEPDVRLIEIRKLNGMSRALSRAGSAFILASTNLEHAQVFGRNAKGWDSLSPFARDQMERNEVTYSTEIGCLTDARTTIFTKLIEAILAEQRVNPQLLDSDNAREALKSTQEDLVAVLADSSHRLQRRGLRDDWRRDRLLALEEIVPAAAAFLTQPQARTVQTEMIASASAMRSSELQARLRALADRFAPR
jgi:hypothetical protein